MRQMSSGCLWISTVPPGLPAGSKKARRSVGKSCSMRMSAIT